MESLQVTFIKIRCIPKDELSFSASTFSPLRAMELYNLRDIELEENSTAGNSYFCTWNPVMKRANSVVSVT